MPKHPKPGDKAPDGKILAIDGSGNSSTLLTEAKKMATAAGSDKVILCFDAITCPFYRAYCAKEMAEVAVAYGVPTLHVYVEAEPATFSTRAGCTASRR